MKRYCFILSWPFEVTGGVNQVVQNLLAEFQRGKDRLGAPLAMQLGWPAKPADTLEGGGTPRIFLYLRSPYVAKRAAISAASFLAHLPGDLLKLRKICRDWNIGVLNMHFPGVEALTLVLLKKLKLFDGAVVLSLHGSDIRSAFQQKGRARRIWRFVLRHASVVVACSEGLKDEALLFEPRAHVIAIYNGIDVDRFSAQADPEFCWPPELAGKKIIINVAQFEFRKGHDILLKAFERVRTAHPDAALVLAGFPGPVSEAVRAAIRDRGLTDSVFIMERVPHSRIYDLLHHSAVFALATRWRKGSMGEGFAIAVLEAAAAKLPMVATASCGVEEIIKDGVTGRVVPLEDDAALAAAISETLSNPEQARIMADKLYELVRERFTWRRAAEQYAALMDPSTESRSH